MFSEISELETIREQKSRLSARERELTTPVLSDVGFISTIYEWFKDLLKDREKSRRLLFEDREKFVFIILRLYSIESLAGGRIANGVREAIAQVLGLKSHNSVSNFSRKLAFRYKNYREFRKDGDFLYGEIENRLKYFQKENNRI